MQTTGITINTNTVFLYFSCIPAVTTNHEACAIDKFTSDQCWSLNAAKDQLKHTFQLLVRCLTITVTCMMFDTANVIHIVHWPWFGPMAIDYM